MAGSSAARRADRLATEEPLEIRASAGSERHSVGVTMRTPGADFELVAGFLQGEGVLRDRTELRRLSYCVDRELSEEQRFNVVNADLSERVRARLSALDRPRLSSSACGVCGKSSLDALRVAGCRALPPSPRVDSQTLLLLPEKLRAAQVIFAATGGLHGVALFDAAGELLVAREDIGRHNAFDKVVGWAFLQDRIPLSDSIAMVSGRIGFEIAQKCVMAGIPIVCAVSAPSSLAVAVAEEFGVTLVGFLRPQRFNVYSRPDRIALDEVAASS